MRASGSRPAAGVDGDSVLLRRAARPPANVSGREQSDERFRTPFELWESPRAAVPKRDPAGVRLHAEEAGAEIRGARLACCRSRLAVYWSPATWSSSACQVSGVSGGGLV